MFLLKAVFHTNFTHTRACYVMTSVTLTAGHLSVVSHGGEEGVIATPYADVRVDRSLQPVCL